MLVSFKFECLKHGEFEVFFTTVEFPDRNFPLEYNCENKDCKRICDRLPPNTGMQPDSYWSGKNIEALNLNNVTSKSYLKRFLKTNGISQLTEDEVGHHTKQKTKKERIKEYLERDDVVRKRKEVINQTLNDYGV